MSEMRSAEKALDQEKIPLIIAITGHRDAILTTDTQLSLERLFSFLSQKMPQTPIWVLSGMAGGADQYATEMALEWRDSGKHSDIKVMAVLPLPEQEYRKDFNEEEAHKFDLLSARVDSKFTLQPYSWPGAQMEKVTLTEDPLQRVSQIYSRERNAQYANLGAYLVRHANFLVALWDGCYHEDSAGGTGDVVRFMLNGRMQWGSDVPPRAEFNPYSLLHGGELGMVAHIPVARAKKGCKESAAAEFCNTPPSGWKGGCSIRFYHTDLRTNVADDAPQQYLHDYQRAEQDQLLQQVECYNRDIEQHRRPSRFSFISGVADFSERLQAAWLPLSDNASAPDNTRATVQRFRAADTLALQYQRQMRRLLIAYMALVTLLFVSYELVGFYSGSHSLAGEVSFVSFVLSSLLLGALYLFTRRKDYKGRLHKYRALAEALRIQFYLLYISDKATVERTFSGTHQRQFPWIAHSMRVCTLFDWSLESGSEIRGWEERLEQVQQHWVEDQINYLKGKLFGGRVEGLKSLVGRLTGYSRLLFLLAFGLMLLLSSVYGTEKFSTNNLLTANEFSLLMLLIVFLIGASGIIREWSTINGYEEDINRFQDSLAAFNRTVLELNSEDPHERREAMVNLAQQALHENTLWYDTHTRLDIEIAP